MNEIWKPIAGYEEWYDVSNLGRIRTWKARGRWDRADSPAVMRLLRGTGGYQVVFLCLQKQVQRTGGISSANRV